MAIKRIRETHQVTEEQPNLVTPPEIEGVAPLRSQLLKWIGNKQRFAHEIASYFPSFPGTYFEPFLGSGAVLGTLAPRVAVASDLSAPLMEIWRTLAENPELLKKWYRERWLKYQAGDRKGAYEEIRSSYNKRPNGADLLFLSRSCYGGVVRFRKRDGFMSTPCGAHWPITPESFSARVDLWASRTRGATFLHRDYRVAFAEAKRGDLIYCDPPYTDSQSILYGAQSFRLSELVAEIDSAKSRGVHVALSIDGTKRSGTHTVRHEFPNGLFEQAVLVNVGRSMLKRFQMNGQTLEDEVVADRLLLTCR